MLLGFLGSANTSSELCRRLRHVCPQLSCHASDFTEQGRKGHRRERGCRNAVLVPGQQLAPDPGGKVSISVDPRWRRNAGACFLRTHHAGTPDSPGLRKAPSPSFPPLSEYEYLSLRPEM